MIGGSSGMTLALALCAATGCLGGCSSASSTDEAAPSQHSAESPTGEAAAPPVVAALAAIVATAAEVAGEVQVRRAGEAHWGPVVTGATFRAGDWVRTGADGYLRVRILDGAQVSLDSGSTLMVDAAAVKAAAPGQEAVVRGAVVTIHQGTARAVVPAGTDLEATPLVVRNPDGTEARLVVRGKGAVAFRLRPGDSTTEVAVTEGQLAVITDDGQREVVLGQAAELAGGKVRTVVRMLGFPVSKSPGIDARYKFEAGMSIEIAWKRVRGAAGYRVQVGTDLSFRELVDDHRVTSLVHTFAPPSPGAYVWRVAAFDGQERFGEFGFTRRIFCETDEPHDFLIAPKHKAKVAYDDKPPAVVFSWQSAGDSDTYRLVIGTSRDPRTASVFEQSTSEQTLTVSSLAAGTYYWGVYAQGDASVPLFLRPRGLLIQKRSAPRAKTDNLWEE